VGDGKKYVRRVKYVGAEFEGKINQGGACDLEYGPSLFF